MSTSTCSLALSQRERFLDCLAFRPVDRVPFEPGGPRKSTLERWRREGLAADADWSAVIRAQLGLPDDCMPGLQGLGVDLRCRPQFEEKVLEHRDGHYVVQDWKGNVVEISDQFDPSYLRNAVDFVTRRWLRLPVNSPGEFAAMRQRYLADDAGRYPADFAAQAARLAGRTRPTTLYLHGPFWQLREWVGFEGLCELFATDPGFIDEMVGFWSGFVEATLRRLLDARILDHVMIAEDMAYKSKPMISPAMAERHLAPCWRRWTAMFHAAGVQVVELDSDGKVDLLMPLWADCGIDAVSPFEVAAGTDLPALRRRFGRRLAFRGGIDKRLIAKGGRHIEAEIQRLQPVIDAGGCIPSCDHGVPSDISWPDFQRYCELLARATGWR